MKVVVTGAAGKLGTHVSRVLTNNRHKVMPTDIVYKGSLTMSQQIVVRDLLDRTAIYDVLHRQSALVHLANLPASIATRDPLRGYHDNTRMNANVFQAAKESGLTHLIYASSSMVIAGDREVGTNQEKSCPLTSLPITGDTPQQPGSLYALSKASGEDLLKYYAEMHGLTCFSLRFPVLLERHMIESIKKDPPDEPMHGLSTDEGFGYLCMEDAAELIAACLNAKLAPGYYCYHPAAPNNYLFKDAQEVAQKYYPNVAINTTDGQLNSLVDTSTIERDLGWKPKFT